MVTGGMGTARLKHFGEGAEMCTRGRVRSREERDSMQFANRKAKAE